MRNDRAAILGNSEPAEKFEVPARKALSVSWGGLERGDAAEIKLQVRTKPLSEQKIDLSAYAPRPEAWGINE